MKEAPVEARQGIADGAAPESRWSAMSGGAEDDPFWTGRRVRIAVIAGCAVFWLVVALALAM
ncbi:hypothetical protein [Consotaella salsifontis]|uniref:Uncharacterized protein n=1 Tax=Consotaella salsifontis TaxID=1365950 RepID=A0A1T4SXS5_9HYPH|nr:hypothetical protein [Consotaella salsifontis]SKA32929.1 hypothetical protein SAMN05428963_11577 [Consotaella salsifontis]